MKFRSTDSAEDSSIPIECYQNDGLQVRSAQGATLLAFGGRIDTANLGTVAFLLDGVYMNGNDTYNIDKWQREGDFADEWGFVGVIDTVGFGSAELRDLRGKDAQQVLLFSDDFTIQALSEPDPAWSRAAGLLAVGVVARRGIGSRACLASEDD